MIERPQQRSHITVRPAHSPGDLGWVVMAHGEVYDQQFGWNTDFEALVAKIVADYANGHDPSREAAWIAEADGQRVGCVFLVAGEEPGTAKLRILLVTPAARGLGIGTRLVEQCLAFARAAGYRRIVLWTNDVLASARRIYQAAGFTLIDEKPHHSFGHDLVGQTWALDLQPQERMIARSWRATATPDGFRRYEQHFRTAVLPELRTVPGFRTACLMRRDDGGVVQIHVLTLWESMAAVTGFAGDPPNVAVVEPAARAVLLSFDETVEHYETEAPCVIPQAAGA